VRPDLIKDLFEKEATYWWNTSKREMVLALLGRARPLKAQGKIGLAVDIGCGGGYTAKVFESHWHTVGIDLSREALQLCQRRGLRRLCQVDMTGFSLPFKTGSLDLVLALDVIEHVEDDVHALKECQRILKGGGLLIVTVPAYMALWSPWDEALGHRRRYNASALAEKIRKLGLSVEKLSYMFFFVFPVAVLIRGMKRLLRRDAMNYSSDFIPIPKVVNDLLILIGRLEQLLIARLGLRLPFGLSVISVITKK